MHKISRFLLVSISVYSAVFFASGCATMHYPKNYVVEGKVVNEFKELDDERALKLVAMIYNVKPEQWEEEVARNISLKEYVGLLKKKNSAYLKKSGVFEMQYDDVNLKTWKDADLAKLYKAIMPKAREYYVETGPELSDMQNTERIIYLTALSAVRTEMDRRGNMRNIVSVGSQILVGALSIALSMI